MRAVSDTTLRSIRARRPHFVILRYLIAPFASSTTAEFGQKISTSGRPIIAKSMSSFPASGRVGCTASRMHEILKVRGAAASPMWTAVNLMRHFCKGSGNRPSVDSLSGPSCCAPMQGSQMQPGGRARWTRLMVRDAR